MRTIPTSRRSPRDDRSRPTPLAGRPEELGRRFVGDLDLVEACRHPGCPVCRCLHDVGRRHLTALVAEHVTDPATRGRLAESYGFCAAHAASLLDVPDAALGVAIVYQELLVRAQVWLEEAGHEARAAAEPGGVWRRRLAFRRRLAPRGVRRRSRCPVCVVVAQAERDYVAAVVGGIDYTGLGVAYGASDGLCLPHLELALARSRGHPGAARLVASTIEKIEQLTADLGRFIDKHDHRVRATFTDGEARSWIRAVQTVAGGAERFGSDME